MKNRDRIETLRRDQTLPREDLRALLTTLTQEDASFLYANAREVREAYYGKEVYLRGLIEFTNYCRNDCLYCGIRCSNRNAQRYRLSEDEIFDCCDKGYALGFRTFVLQGGEDLFFTDERVCALVRGIKDRHPDCAVTLSIGERPRESYRAFFDAGADRYLLRHETINPDHYRLLHPAALTIENRRRCLTDLREIGFQVGCGMMVGSPFQTTDYLLDDLYFMKEFRPHMIGSGPFIPHADTPLSRMRTRPSGTRHPGPWRTPFTCWPSSGSCIRASCCRRRPPWGPSIRRGGRWAFRRAPMWSCPTCPRPASATSTCSTTARSARATRPRSAAAAWSCAWRRSVTTSRSRAEIPAWRQRLAE